MELEYINRMLVTAYGALTGLLFIFFTATTMSNTHFELIHRKSGALKKQIDPLGGLLDELARDEVFTSRDVNRVKSKSTEDDMAAEMISVLQRKPDAAFDRFLDALQATGQEHVVNEIKGRTSGLPTGLELDLLALRGLIILLFDCQLCTYQRYTHITRIRYVHRIIVKQSQCTDNLYI